MSKKKKGLLKSLYIFIGILVFCVVGYVLAVFTNIPVLSTMRNIWIETAMTTADHQWLATKFIPKSVIDEVMSAKVEDTGQIGITDIKKHYGLDYSDSGIFYDLSKFENSSELFSDINTGSEIKTEADI